MSVTIVGTVALDTIETPVGKHERILGGSATFAGTAASIFSNTSLVSIVGKDFPQSHIDYFKNRNININNLFNNYNHLTLINFRKIFSKDYYFYSRKWFI